MRRLIRDKKMKTIHVILDHVCQKSFVAPLNDDVYAGASPPYRHLIIGIVLSKKNSVIYSNFCHFKPV